MTGYLKHSLALLTFPLLILTSPASVYAGFLEMPETQEVPELEEGTMLLDLDIPNVRERDPDPQGGPRLNVKEFRVQGIVESPELGITRAELIERVEGIRFDIMREGEQLDSGYTIDEVSEVSDLLAEIEDETKGEHVTPVEVQRLVFLIRDQRRKRGVTLGMIEAVADVITRYYRERGFILAKAYIPKQHVRDGIVTLTLLLGELGEVQVHENKRYSDRIIERNFDSAMGEPVTAAGIEERLYLVNDLPGLSVRGYFEPGLQVGDTKLNINVNSEQWYDANVRLDNHGTEGSGENRVYADAMIYNPTRTGDQLQIGVLASFEPANTLYGLLRYQTNILHPRVVMSMGASSNEFTLDQYDEELEGLNVSGKSRIYDITGSYKFKRSRVSNHSLDMVVNTIESESTFGSDDDIVQTDVVNNVILSYKFDVLNEQKRSLHQGGLSFTSSTLKKNEDYLEEDVTNSVFNYDYAFLTFVDLPLIKDDSRILVRSSGQYVGAPITSAMQFGTGGPTLTRGFAVNEFYADDVVFAGVDWIFDGPGFSKVELFGDKLSNVIQPYIFMDAAYGIKKAPENEPDTVDVIGEFGDVGFGLRFNVKGVRSNFIFASPVHRKVSSEIEALETESRLFFDIQYSF